MKRGCIVAHVFGGRFTRYATEDKSVKRTGGTWASKYGKTIVDWDTAPPPEYFAELFRVSRNQIIWGGNYFPLPPTRCFIVWDKLNIGETFSMSMCEYAWTSFNGNAKIIKCVPQGTAQDPRIHPTQKPVALYSKLLQWYAKPGDKVLDTHAGSASLAIACHRAGYEWMAIESNERYYALAQERIARETAQLTMFFMEDAGRWTQNAKENGT
ncbi:MAG: site-specific DNA-methyltransferase [Oscillospiraceae bacterium]|nr:site-specific DNA-methyltransferase [Oscillospiraceae bacterium]